jgi:hypothetical protein
MLVVKQMVCLIVLSLGFITVVQSQNSNSTAVQILKKLGRCQAISKDFYATDANKKPSIAVCNTKNTVWWTADMDIDCDGIPTTQCNLQTDSAYQNQTALETSQKQAFNAATMPYVVLPNPSKRWNYQNSSIQLGAVVAVIFNNQIEYAVFADTGPEEIIGEGSYALAQRLGIDPDPSTGGADSDVTYIVFKNSLVNPVESHPAAIQLGQQLVQKFLSEK